MLGIRRICTVAGTWSSSAVTSQACKMSSADICPGNTQKFLAKLRKNGLHYPGETWRSHRKKVLRTVLAHLVKSNLKRFEYERVRWSYGLHWYLILSFVGPGTVILLDFDRIWQTADVFFIIYCMMNQFFFDLLRIYEQFRTVTTDHVVQMMNCDSFALIKCGGYDSSMDIACSITVDKVVNLE